MCALSPCYTITAGCHGSREVALATVYRQQSTEPVRCELCLPLPDPVVFAVFFLSEYREAERDRELNPVPMEGAPGSDGGEKECMEKTVKRLRVR